MKKEINLDEILNQIAIEKAPEDLILKWKAEIELQKERKTLSLVLLRPSIVFPLLFAGFWYCFFTFKKELFEYYLLDKLNYLFGELNMIASNATSSMFSSFSYIVGMGVFSILFATFSLFWFYQGKKLRYSRIRVW